MEGDRFKSDDPESLTENFNKLINLSAVIPANRVWNQAEILEATTEGGTKKLKKSKDAAIKEMKQPTPSPPPSPSPSPLAVAPKLNKQPSSLGLMAQLQQPSAPVPVATPPTEIMKPRPRMVSKGSAVSSSFQSFFKAKETDGLKDLLPHKITRSQSEPFLHSWDYNPYYVPTARDKRTPSTHDAKPERPVSRDKAQRLVSRASKQILRQSIVLDQIAEQQRQDIVFTRDKNGELKVKAGTLEKLVEKLADEEGQDKEYVQHFIYSHRHFTTSEDFLQKLIERYHIKRMGGQTPEAYQKLKMFVQIRVMNVLKKWVEADFVCIADDPLLTGKLKEFLASVLENGGDQANWSRLISNRIQAEEAKLNQRLPTYPDPDPNSLSQFLDFHPIDIANQMTLIDMELFRAIKPTEFLKLAWAGKDKSKAPHIMAMIERFNKVTYWVATEIVLTPNIKQRITVVERFIQIAEYLKKINNFHGVMQIYSALNLAAIQRLKHTWKGINHKFIVILKDIEQLLDAQGNYKTYRALIKNINPPALPFTGVHLSDLVFLEENPNTVDGGLINFEKMILFAEITKEVLQFQEQPYNFEVIPETRGFVAAPTLVLNEQALFKGSKKCEPSTVEAPMQKTKSGWFSSLKKNVFG